MKKKLLLFVLFSLLWLMPSLAQNHNILSIPDFTVANAKTIVLPIDLENTSDVVAVQFTMQVPTGITLDASSASLIATRTDGHAMRFRAIGGNKYMCMISSVRNKLIKGSDGTLLTVALTKSSNQGYFNCPVTLSDVVIATADGTDVTTGLHSGNITFRPLDGQTICGGEETSAVDFYQLSPVFDYGWAVKEEPASIEGYSDKGKTVIPQMTLTNESIGDDNLVYTVNATYGDLAIYSFEYTIKVRPTLIGAFFNVTPADEGVAQSNAVTLTWNNIINAVYDVYLWNTGATEPASPIASNLTATHFSANSHCTDGETYNWKVVAHNECQEVISDTYSFSVRDLPDLHVTRIDCSNTVAGQKMTVEWTVKNDGIGSTEDAEWKDYIWLVPDMKLGTATTGSKLLKTVDHVKALDAGESYNNSYQVDMEERVYGDYYILVTSDMYNVTNIDWPTETPPNPYNPASTGYVTAATTNSYSTLAEVMTNGKKDNFFYKKINITVPPLADLQIPSIQVLKDGAPVSEVFAGTTVDVIVTIKNGGDVAVTNKTVTNVLYYSAKNFHDDAPLTTVKTSSKTLNLVEDATVEEHYTMTIPTRYHGDLYFHAYTDKNDVVFELANIENNWGASEKVNVLVAPGADLQPTAVATKAQNVTANETITISYSVENMGAGAPDVNNWNDKIYLCQSADELTSSATLLATIPVTYTSDSYSKDVNVKLGSLTGTYYIYVVADAEDKVFEFEGEDNNTLRSTNTITFVKPDLTVELTNIYADVIKSNETVSFEWKLKNIGTGDLQDVRVTDSFYASSSPSGANARFLGSVTNDLWIPAGSERKMRGTLTIPYGSAFDGSQYIFVKTDTENVVSEESESNNMSNTLSHACQFLPKPTFYPDLVVSNAVTPETVETGSYPAASWTCTNSGSTDAGTFSTAIYLSDDATWSSNDVLVSKKSVASLTAGASIDVAVDMYMKDSYADKKYFIVVADNKSEIGEDDESNNWVALPVAITQKPAPALPDITIPFAKVPESINTSEYVTINWTCSNIGTADAGAFTNGIYISDDEFLSADDVLLVTQRTVSLKQDASTDYQTHLCLAEEYAGQKYLIFKGDINNNLDEVSKANNAKAVAVTVVEVQKPEPSVDPDHASDLTISAASTSPASGLTSSSDFTLNWTCNNIGTDDATASMTGIYLSDDATLSSDDALLATQFIATLAQGSAIDYQTVLNIPDLNSGNKYIIICADIDKTVAEISETNNTCSLAVSIRKRTTASSCDLIATAVSVPATITVTEGCVTKWRVNNSGSLEASSFMSALYLSADAAWSKDDELLATEITKNLAAGSSADYEFTVLIDKKFTGDRYLIFRTDINNSISESTKENNYVIRAVNVATSSLPTDEKLADLAVECVTLPEELTTSEEFTAQWAISNTGEAKATSFINAVYLSDNDSYSDDDVLLGSERTTSLAVGSQATYETKLTIADKYNGNKYLLFIANAYNNVAESKVANNLKAVPVTIACAPLPDLKITAVKCERELTAGQELEVSITAANVGETALRQARWVTEIYLSQNVTFNKANAAKVGSASRSGSLTPGEEYSETVTVTLPEDVSGNYLLYAYVDALDAVYESNENNNVSKGSVVQIYPVNERSVNLAIRKLDAPSTVQAGENITITYRVDNDGEFAAKGTLRDVIYLSKDEVWDYNDIQVGVATGKVDVPAGQGITREATGRIVNVPEGKYYFIVKTNSTRSIPETTEVDNIAVNYSSSEVVFQTLQLGVAEDVSTCGYYKVPINAISNSQTVGFTLTHPEYLPAGLYVRYEGVPSTAKYDYASTELSAEQQSVILPVAQTGTYYILAQDNAALVNNDGYAFSLTGGDEWNGADMQLIADRINFGATTLSVTEGGTDGWITTNIRGALFDSIMDFRLTADPHVIPVEYLVFHDQTSTTATFNLHHAEVGMYDVVSELPNGARATLPDGFRVIPGVKSKLGIKIDAPRVVHGGAHAPVTIAYANGGTNDIQIKGILVKMQGAFLGKTVSDFKKAETELYFVPEGYEPDRFGYISIPPGTQKVLNFFMEQHAGTSHMQVYIIK